jgi:acyl carrier protein phosphodiesterase
MMNFLAHLYLSGDDADVMTGNFIGDFVRGRNLAEQFGKQIAKGIELHRAIDMFTDHHDVVRQSKARLRPKYGHYSGVIVDIFYDHFLALNWSTYSSESLDQYARKAYAHLADRDAILPERVKQMMPYMVGGNWLVNYAGLEGIRRSLAGMARRATFNSKMDEAIDDLQRDHDAFQNDFDLFFPELANFSKEFLRNHSTSV